MESIHFNESAGELLEPRQRRFLQCLSYKAVSSFCNTKWLSILCSLIFLSMESQYFLRLVEPAYSSGTIYHKKGVPKQGGVGGGVIHFMQKLSPIYGFSVKVDILLVTMVPCSIL